MFSTLLMDEDRRGSSHHSRKSLSDNEEEDKGCTFAKVRAWIKLFMAHLFSHVGLTALVFGYSIMGAFIFSHLEGAAELATRKAVGNNRKDTLEQLYNITENLRLTVITKDIKIRELETELQLVRAARKKCKREKRLQFNFLESVIAQCKGDNVPLTEVRCSVFCEKNKVRVAVCKELCESLAPPCTYWHQDTIKDPVVDFETVMNRSRRWIREGDEWNSRLRAYRHLRETDEESVEENVEDGLWDMDELLEPPEHEKKWRVLKPSESTGSNSSNSSSPQCEFISCVEEAGIKTVACLDMGLVAQKPGYFAGNVRSKLLRQPKHFNVLWKQNWTREAERVLKLFEWDVIRKVKNDGYDGKDATEEGGEEVQPSQWSMPSALLYSVTIITTIGYGNIAPQTMWGQIATMGYAIFGIPIFMLWASNVGTLMAQTFTILYANVCCFVCRRGKRKKALKAKQRQEERERDSAVRLLYSERECSPAPTTYSKMDAMSPYMQRATSSATPTLGRAGDMFDPGVKDLLNTCAKYNLEEGDDDDPLSEQVVEEIRHADAMDIINERSLQASPLTSPQRSPLPPRAAALRGEREGSYYENPKDTPDRETAGPRSISRLDFKSPTTSLDRRRQLTHPSVATFSKKERAANNLLLTPPTIHSSRVSPVMGIAPKASREPSPTYSTAKVKPGDEDSLMVKSTLGTQSRSGGGAVESADSTPERVPALPVLCFLVFYLFLGAVIFSSWENWSFLEGFYFSFITLTTVGLGDFVPGDSVMNVDSRDGQYKLMCSVVYVLLGLAVLSMSLNLIQEEVVDFAIKVAKDCGCIDDDDDEEEYPETS